MDLVDRDTDELDIPLAIAGRRGGADDRDGDAAIPVRGGVCDSCLPAGHPQLGGRKPGDCNQPGGQWQLQAQVLHWRGDTARGGENTSSVFGVAARAARLPTGRAGESPSVTIDEPNRLAAVISGPVIMHTYLVAHPENSTISELTLWSSETPEVPWPVISDAQVLDAMTSPVCAAYIGSC